MEIFFIAWAVINVGFIVVSMEDSFHNPIGLDTIDEIKNKDFRIKHLIKSIVFPIYAVYFVVVLIVFALAYIWDKPLNPRKWKNK